MKLDREQIMQIIEHCIKDECEQCILFKESGNCVDNLAPNISALVVSYEQKIFELENRLKECENGYEGTLHLESCKLYDAEDKIKELTKENENLHSSCTELTRKCASLNDEVADLRAIAEQYQKQFEEARSDTVRDITKRLTAVLKVSLTADNEAFVPVSAVARALAIASAGEEFGGEADGEKPLL